MEKLLTSINYDNPNLYNYNVENVYPKLRDFFEGIDKSTRKNQQILEWLGLLVKLTSQIGFKTREYKEKESAHYYLIKQFLDEIDFDRPTQDDINAVVKLFQQIGSLKTHNRNHIYIVGSLLQSFKPTDVIKLLGPKAYSQLIQAIKTIQFKISLDYLYACYEDIARDNLKELAYRCRNHESYSSYRYALENLIDLDITNFTQVLPDIQGLFEHCVLNSNDPFVSLNPIAAKILYVVSYFDVKPKNCLYFDMPGSDETKTKAKINQLIDFYKSLVLKVNHVDDDKFESFNVRNFQSLLKQIVLLFEYEEPSQGYRIFISSWQKLFDAYFEIYAKAVRNDVRDEILRVDVRKICTKSKTKFKDLKQFNLYLITKLTELTRFLNNNYKEIDSRSPKPPGCLESYYDFCYTMVEYISHEVSDTKTCCQPCVEYLVELSKGVHVSTDFLRVIYDLLWKDNFFVLTNFSSETVLIVDNLLEVAYEFAEIHGKIEDKNLEKRYDYLKKSLNCFKKRVEKFAEPRLAIQECLFEKMFYKPVVLNIQGEKFFYSLTDELFELFDPTSIYATHQSKFATLLAFFISNDILETLHSNGDDIHYMTRYYSQWSGKLGIVLKIASTFDEKFLLSLVEIVKKVDELDSYVNLFEANTLTINYQIVKEFATNAFQNVKSNEKFLSSLIDVWIKIYEKNMKDSQKNKQINNEFLWTMKSATSNFAKLLVPFVDKFWEFYLENMDTQELASIVESILPSTQDVFMKKYSKKFTEQILNDFDDKFIKNFMIFNRLIKVSPMYYMQVENNKLLISRFVTRAKTSKTEHLLSSVLSLVNLLINEIKANKQLEQEASPVLFTHRIEFWEFIYTEKSKNKFERFKISGFSTDWLVYSIGEIYYSLLRNMPSKENKKNAVKTFVSEMLNYFDHTEPRDSRPFQILDIIRGIGEFGNKEYLNVVREHRARFVELRKDSQSDPNAIKSVESLIDLIDDRNLQTFSVKLDENEQKIERINEDLSEKGAEIRALDENVRSNDQRVKELKGDVAQINERVDAMSRRIDEQNARIDGLDEKTLFNVPPWCKHVKESMKKQRQDWILLAKRLNFSDRDIKGWLNQIDPFMGMLQEWFVANKTSDAIVGLMKAFKELGNKECVQIIQENLDRIEEESKTRFQDYNIDDKMKKNPSHVFICYEMSIREKAELLQRHLFERINRECGVVDLDAADNRINVWFDDGRMGGGVERNKRIDLGMRLCNVLVCLITPESSKDKTCLNQINLAVQLNKPIIPLLLDSKLKWPPSGSLGPILSEYLFIRFFQRPPKELTNDERYWPVDKFTELVMQLKQLIPFTLEASSKAIILNPSLGNESKEHPEVFISYQWDKQKQIIKLYEKLSNLGIKCWLDIHQMGGGDSLYFKIDEGIRNCCAVISCVTMRYSQSANCRKEIALADSVSKPIVPILIEKGLKYPPPGPMSPTLGVLKRIDFAKNIGPNNEDISWEGKPFKDLLTALKPHVPQKTVDVVTSRACIIS